MGPHAPWVRVNVRGAWLHVLSDTLGSIGVITAAVLVWAFGWTRADPIASIGIALLVIFASWQLLRETVGVLMEGVPSEVSIEGLETTIRATPGVREVHDLHAWSISDGFPVVTVHVVVDPAFDGCVVAREVGQRLRDEHGIAHATVQPEGTDAHADTAQRVITNTAT